MGADKYGTPSFRNLPVSPSIPAALDGLSFLTILRLSLHQNERMKMVSFSILDYYSMPALNLNCINVLD